MYLGICRHEGFGHLSFQWEGRIFFIQPSGGVAILDSVAAPTWEECQETQ